MHSYLYYPLTSEIHELKIAKIGKFDPECKSEIEKWDIDMGFKRTLQWYWFKSEVCVGPTLYSVKQIIECEKEMANLKNGMRLGQTRRQMVERIRRRYGAALKH